MFITKKHLSRQNAAEGRRREPGVAAARRHGARRHGACPDRCRTQVPRGLLLYSPRRDHAQHRAWPGDGQVDAQRCRRRFQTQPDSLSAGASQEVRHFVRQPREQGQRRFGSHTQSCNVAQRHASGPDRVAHPHMTRNSRSGDREGDQPGHTASVARSRRRDDRSKRRGWRRLLYHVVLPRCGIASADGIQSAKSFPAAVRRRRQSGRARVHRSPNPQRSGSHLGPHEETSGPTRE